MKGGRAAAVAAAAAANQKSDFSSSSSFSSSSLFEDNAAAAAAAEAAAMRARARRNASGVPSIGFHPSLSEDEELDEAALHIQQHLDEQQQYGSSDEAR